MDSLVAVLLERLNALSDSISQIAISLVSLNSAAKTNQDGIATLSSQQAVLDTRIGAIESHRAAVKAVSDSDAARLNTVSKFFSDYWPLLTGIILSVIGIGTRIWGWW